jgi:hypothetical protein
MKYILFISFFLLINLLGCSERPSDEISRIEKGLVPELNELIKKGRFDIPNGYKCQIKFTDGSSFILIPVRSSIYAVSFDYCFKASDKDEFVKETGTQNKQIDFELTIGNKNFIVGARNKSTSTLEYLGQPGDILDSSVSTGKVDCATNHFTHKQ